MNIPISEIREGDLCQRVAPNGNTLQIGETYVITKVNRASARGYRTKDGVSVNQSFKSIIILKHNTKLSIIDKIRYSLVRLLIKK